MFMLLEEGILIFLRILMDLRFGFGIFKGIGGFWLIEIWVWIKGIWILRMLRRCLIIDFFFCVYFISFFLLILFRKDFKFLIFFCIFFFFVVEKYFVCLVILIKFWVIFKFDRRFFCNFLLGLSSIFFIFLSFFLFLFIFSIIVVIFFCLFVWRFVFSLLIFVLYCEIFCLFLVCNLSNDFFSFFVNKVKEFIICVC